MSLNRIRNINVGYQITLHVAFILILVATMAVVTVFQLVKLNIEEQEDMSINNTVSEIRHSIESSNKASESIELYLNQRLYEISKIAADRLKHKKDVKDVTREDLESLKNELGLYDISLLAWAGPDKITIQQSSDPNEIGQDVDTWGMYWPKLMREMMRQQKVTTKEGWSARNFWVSPIALSQHDPNKYFKNAYYFDGETNYLLNPNIIDSQIATLKKTFDFNHTIDQILSNQPNIVEIGIINIKPYLNPVDIVEYPDSQLPVPYGKHSFERPNDKKIFTALLKERNLRKDRFTIEGVAYTKFYIPLEGDRAITIIIQDVTIDKFQEFFFVVIVSFCLALIFIAFTIHYVTKKRLQPLKQIENHLALVSDGDFKNHLQVDDKNELGWLAERINEMTKKMGELFEENERRAQNEIRIKEETFKNELAQTEQTYNRELKQLADDIEMYSRHDWKNLVQVLHGLLIKGDLQEALEYTKQLIKDEQNQMLKATWSVQIPNAPLNIILISKKTRADLMKIDIEFDIQPDPYDKISSSDLTKVATNLIDNAFEALKDIKDKERKVWVSLRPLFNSFYELSVKNNGPMIPADNINNIFNKGFSTKSHKYDKNKGFGLWIVKDIVEKYEGEVAVHSDENETKFAVIIPARMVK